MWYRLKSSLLTALIAAMLVLGVKGLAEPVEAEIVSPAPLQMIDASDRAALALAVQLAALAIDAAVDADSKAASTTDGKATRVSTAARDSAQRRALRMPFYSFATRSARARES